MSKGELDGKMARCVENIIKFIELDMLEKMASHNCHRHDDEEACDEETRIWNEKTDMVSKLRKSCGAKASDKIRPLFPK